MTLYINKSQKILLDLASDGSEDSFITSGFVLASDDDVAEFRAAQDAENEPSPEEILKAANDKRDLLLTNAGLRIAPLQDAADLGEATDADTANLKLWKQYRIAVNRVGEQPGYPETIEWPLQPA
ncbi:tail fiber assembly protein [Pseudomonas fluorescens]|uniref:tail fiber assembly protein n=1 Tax=Pseudomonas fluorescens TaxID=294 RepID=UPI001CD6B8B3|nr:tail fiber assembly protein [Pseudomonas fluorescens]